MFNIIRGLPHHRHLVAYLYPAPTDGDMIRRLSDHKIPVELVNKEVNGYWPDYVQLPEKKLHDNLLSVIRKFRPHVVFRHFWAGRETGGGVVPLPRPKLLYPRPRYVCIIHDFFGAPPGYDFYVPTSYDNDTNYQQHLPASRKRIIYNGIETAVYDIPQKPHDGFVIGRAATLLEKKIPEDFADFLASFNIPQAKFVFAGDGPRKEHFIKRVKELNKESQFNFLGTIDYYDMPEFLSGIDITCYMTESHVETFSMAMIEAATAGVVIVAEPRGSMPEQIVHGETGFLGRTRKEIKEYCELLAQDRNLLRQMSNSARRFGRRFTIAKQAASYDEVAMLIRRMRPSPIPSAPSPPTPPPPPPVE